MKPIAEQIDNLLPQTQCGQCGYGGCMPYAKAIEQGETITRCPPGGVKTLLNLASLLNQQLTEQEIETVRQQEKPSLQAYIKADECIGCTKCIQACPVDAIIGAAKQLHTVLTTECTGCELCVTPCPVDCITMVTMPAKAYEAAKARQRFTAKQQRMKKVTKIIASPVATTTQLDAKKAYIQAAIQRVKNKKLPGKPGSFF